MMRKVAYSRHTASRHTARGFSVPSSYRKTLTSALAVATMLAMPVANKARAAGGINPAFTITANNAAEITAATGTTSFEITAPTSVITYAGTGRRAPEPYFGG